VLAQNTKSAAKVAQKGNAQKTNVQKGSTKKGSTKKGSVQQNRTAAKKASSVYEDKYVLTEKDIKIRGEIKLLLALGLTFLLMLSNFGLLPPVGSYISYFMFGMTGVMAYILPVLIFLAAAFLISNRKNKKALHKFFAALALTIFLISLIHLVFMGYHADNTGFYYYFYCGENKCGGGLIGALFVGLLCKIVGVVGAYILLIIFIIISCVIITERSFIGGVKKGSRKVYNTAREDVSRIRETSKEYAREKQYQKSRRIHKVAKGVNLNKIEDPAKTAEGMHEINEETLKQAFTEEEALNIIQAGAKKKKKQVSQRPTMIDIITDTEKENTSEEIREEKHTEEEPPLNDEGQIAYSVQEEPRGSYETYQENNKREIPKSFRTNATASFIKSVEDISVEKEEKEELVYIDKDGNYKAKERIQVSESAKAVMSRPAFGMSGVYGAGISASKVSDRPKPDSSPEMEISNTEEPYGSETEAEKIDSALGPDGAVEIVRADVENSVFEGEAVQPVKKSKNYILPRTNLLNKGQNGSSNTNKEELGETADKLEQILQNFGVKAKVTEFHKGPSVTRYEIQPEIGIRLNKITTLADDIKLNLAATDIRIEPIPGKSTIGIEVPNKVRETVTIRELIESKELIGHKSKIAFAAGKDIAGQVVVTDIAKMPHFLIAGTTGSGKSVFTNSIIMSILFRAKPDEVRLIIVDPKVVEFGIYNGIPHLLQPVVTDPKLASNTLKWAVAEMQDRYKKFAECNVRDLKGYNEKISDMAGAEEGPKLLPQIVIVIDELADLMMAAAKEVEESICRLAQLARAAGIHLIIATQRPSVDVVTGLIKANIPSRCALMVSSGVDSRTVIDSVGAEKLLGNGDMLFYPSGYVKPVRLQGAFVSDTEVQRVVDFWSSQADGVNYDESISEYVASQPVETSGGSANGAAENDGRDEYFMDAARFVVEKEKASTSMLQRVFKIGFNRAARIIEQLEEAGIIGEEEGTKPRKVLVTQIELENLMK